MLQLYNKNKVKIKGLKSYKDYKVESVLSTGDKKLSFLYPIKLGKEIEEEGYIRTKTEEFVIKEIKDNNDWKSIVATMNVESLEGQAWEHFDTTEQTIGQCLTLAVAGTGWIVQVNGSTKKRTVRLTNCSSWEIIQQAKKTYRVEICFDTLNKTIKIYEIMGGDKGAYFIDSLNLKALEVQSSSYDYYTRIIAIGKDDLKVTVENYQYSSKKKTLIWKDERYTDVNSLREDATLKLNEISKPYRAYSADVVDLANVSEKYKTILAYGLGDTITLIDSDKGIKEKQRIAKIIEYPEEPERNTCEISNILLSFIDMQKEQQDTTDTVNNITSDNGTISENAISEGSIRVAVEHLTINKLDVNDLNAVTIRVGTLEATKANITELNVVVANIETLNADKANITDLTATNAKITVLEATTAQIVVLQAETASIKDLAVINANIINLLADKATIKDLVAGTARISELEATRATITDLTATNAKIGTLQVDTATIKTLIAGNLTGENIQAGGITSDKLTIQNGFITNLMVASLDVSKINAGTISTSKFQIKSDDGGIEIVGATQQFKDKNNKVRIQMGKDTQGNFNFILRGEDGTTTLIDHTGIKPGAIANDLIIGNMIATDAVGEKQIDYTSFTTGFNKDTNTNIIKSSKVQLDGTNQTLNVAFNSLSTTVNDIEIGGRNLLLDSDFELGTFTGGTVNGGVNSLDSSIHYQGTKSWKIVTSSAGSSSGGCVWCYNLIVGKKYTVSLKVLCPTTDSVSLFIHASNWSSLSSNRLNLVANVWTDAVVSFVATETSIKVSLLNGTLKSITYYVDTIKVESGTKATDYTVAPEDTDQAINDVKEITTSNTTAIGIQQGKINIAIANSQIIKDGKTILLKDDYNTTVATVNSINTTIGKQQSIIDANTGKITGVSTQVTEVKKNLDGITQRVASSETNVNNVTKTANQGVTDALSAKVIADQAVKDAQNAQSSADNIQVGGRNLIPLSWLSNINLLSVNSFEASVWASQLLTNEQVLKIFEPNTTYYIKARYTLKSISALPVYSLNIGFNLYSGGTGSFSFGGTGSLSKIGNVYEASVVFTTPTTLGDKSLLFYTNRYTNGTAVELGKVLVENLKIEKGNKDTDWTPAPEDVQKQLDKALQDALTAQKQANKGVDDANNAQTQANKAINDALNASNKAGQSLVDAKNYTNAQITTVNTSVSNNVSEINILKKNIELKVEQTDVNNSISNITIGGRNLLLNSSVERNGGVREYLFYANINPALDNYGAGQYTFSFDIKVTKPGNLNVYCTDTSDRKYSFTQKTFFVTTSYVRYYMTVQVSIFTPSQLRTSLAFYGTYGTGVIPYVKNVKIELGNKVTDYTVAPEDTDQVIADAIIVTEENIKQAKASIKIETDSITQRVSSTETNVVTITNSVNTTNNNISAVTTRVSNTEESIKTQAGQIALKATQNSLDTTNNSLGAVATRMTNAEGSLTVQANQIASKVTQSDINNSVDKIQIGGRNLILNSQGDFYLPASNTGTESDMWRYYTFNQFSKLLVLNVTYTFTAEVEITNGAFDSITILNYPNGAGRSVPIINGKIQATFTKTNDTSNSILVYAGISGATRNQGIKIRNVKLEEGNKSTDYTIAPEDIQGQIDGATTRISSAETSITQLSGSITLKANQSSLVTTNSNVTTAQNSANTANTNVTALTTRVATAEASLSVLPGQIDLKATKTDLNTTINNLGSVTNRVSTAEGTISTQAGQINLKASQTSLNTTNNNLNGVANRVSSAEASINVQASQIAQKVNTGDFGTLITQNTTSVRTSIGQIGGNNLIKNSIFEFGTASWGTNGYSQINTVEAKNWIGYNRNCIHILANEANRGLYQGFLTIIGRTYTVSFMACMNTAHNIGHTNIGIEGIYSENVNGRFNFTHYAHTFTATKISYSFVAYANGGAGFFLSEVQVVEGPNDPMWSPNSNELKSSCFEISDEHARFTGSNGSYTEFVPGSTGLKWHQNSSDGGRDYHYLLFKGSVSLVESQSTVRITLPDIFRGKNYLVSWQTGNVFPRNEGDLLYSANAELVAEDRNQGWFEIKAAMMCRNPNTEGTPSWKGKMNIIYSVVA